MTPSTELTLFTVITLFGCILALSCLPWRKNMNICSVVLSSWLFVGCSVFFLNSLAMNAKIWCDISTKLMIGAYVGVPGSILCVLNHLYMTIFAPDFLPDKRLYQLLCKLTLMLGMPALIIVIHIIVQDRRYIFIEQAGCIPSISLSLFPLISILVWPALFGVASLAYLGLIIHLVLSQGRGQRAPSAPPEMVALSHSLRTLASLFVGVVCTSSASLLLLVWIVNNPNISVNSLHHDFQTVDVLPTNQWSHNPKLRAAVELRWLWLSSSFALMIGLFPKERANRLFAWFVSVKMYFRTRTWPQALSSDVCHGSLPVYIARSSSSPSGQAPVIPPLVRQSTLAPTLCSRLSSARCQQPVVPLQTPEPDTRSALSQTCETETIRPNARPFGPQDTPQTCETSQSNPISQQMEPDLNPASTSTLADSAYPPSPLGGASSYQTCEESVGC